MSRHLNYKKTAYGLLIFGIIILAYQVFSSFILSPNAIEKNTTIALQSVSKDDINNNIESYKESKQVIDTNNISLKQLPSSFKISADSVLGGIYIPSSDILLPITFGESKGLLNNSATMLKTSNKFGEGNFVLGANSTANKKLLFTPLLDIEKKDKIFITNKDKIFLYEVTSKERINKERNDFLDDKQDKKTLTLITRFKSKEMDKLVMVTADLKAEAEFDEAGDKMIAMFNGSKN